MNVLSLFDGKSKLFFEFVRILRETNPKYFLLENVKMKKEWENIITDILKVNPIEIDSTLVSAQKRQRLYWTNIPSITQPKNKYVYIKDILDKTNNYISIDELIWFENNEYRVKNATKKGFLVVNNYDCINLDFPNSKTRRGRVAQQKSNTLNTGCNQGIFINGKVKRLTPLECERLQTIPDNYTNGFSNHQRYKMIGNGWTVGIISHILKNIKE